MRCLHLAVLIVALSPGLATAQTTADTDRLLDIAIVYTSTAARQAGGNQAIVERADHAVRVANAAMVTSGADVRFDLVRKREVDYQATSPEQALTDLSAAVSGSGQAPDALSRVTSIVRRHQPDMVVLFVNESFDSARASLLMSLQNVGARCMVVPSNNTVAFAHELGHVLGINHDEPDARSIYPYARGYTGAQPYTASTLVGGYAENGQPSIGKVNVFSTPTRSFRGAPLGDAQGSDAVRTINQVVNAVDAAQSSETRWTGAVSDDWHTDDNWRPRRVPTRFRDVVISLGAPNNPVARAEAEARSLRIDPGATLTLSGTPLLVRGDLTARGTLDASTGTLTVLSVADRPSVLSLSPASKVEELRIGTPREHAWAVLDQPVQAEGSISVGRWSVLDMAGHTTSPVPTQGAASFTFPVPTTSGSYINPAPGWYSIAERGNPAYTWSFGGPDGQLFLSTMGSMYQDRPDFMFKVDAWAFAESMALASGTTYTVSYEIKSDEPQLDLSLHHGQGLLPSLMQPAGPPERVVGATTWTRVERSFTVASSGLYVLALRAAFGFGESTPPSQTFVRNVTLTRT
ncbi:MAG: M12 family metallo-peptidase [Bacteroidota bacterium]